MVRDHVMTVVVGRGVDSCGMTSVRPKVLGENGEGEPLGRETTDVISELERLSATSSRRTLETIIRRHLHLARRTTSATSSTLTGTSGAH